MSYCRFSSDDFQCDIYCYESDEGFQIHVAAARPVLNAGDLPPAVPFSQEHFDEWVERHQAVMDWVSEAEHRPIGLPHEGHRLQRAGLRN